MSERISDERLAVLGRNALLVALKAEQKRAEAAEAQLEAAEKHNEILAAANRDYMTKLEAVRGLIPGWKEGDFNLPDYARGKMDGRLECADELEALLDKEQTK